MSINGASASELRTELGTILTFERSGVRYVLGGALAPAARRSAGAASLQVDGEAPPSADAPPVRAAGWSSATGDRSRSTTST